MASSECVTTTATNTAGVKTITTTCTSDPGWVWAHWGWIVLGTVVVLSIGYAVCQWYDRRDARRRDARVMAAYEKAEAAARGARRKPETPTSENPPAARFPLGLVLIGVGVLVSGVATVARIVT